MEADIIYDSKIRLVHEKSAFIRKLRLVDQSKSTFFKPHIRALVSLVYTRHCRDFKEVVGEGSSWAFVEFFVNLPSSASFENIRKPF